MGPCIVRTLYVDVEVRIRLLMVEGAIVDCRLSPAVSIVSVPNRVRLLMNPVPSGLALHFLDSKLHEHHVEAATSAAAANTAFALPNCRPYRRNVGTRRAPNPIR